MPPLQMVGVRQIMAGLAYVIFFWFKGARLPKRHEWTPILFLSFLNFMVSNGLATWGVKLTTAGVSSILGAIFPLWLAIILSFREGGRIPVLAWFGISLGFTGVCIVFYENLQFLFDSSFAIGVALGLLAALAWAFGTIYTKEHAIKFNPYHSIGWQMLISGITLNTIASATGQTIPLWEVKMYTWYAILFLVIVSSILAFLAYLYALQKLPTNLVSIYAYINPLVAVVSGNIFIGEPLTGLIIGGAMVTLLGVYIVNISLRRVKVSIVPPVEKTD
jgi:drug/metabolite transporter (DMT)-like permease